MSFVVKNLISIYLIDCFILRSAIVNTDPIFLPYCIQYIFFCNVYNLLKSCFFIMMFPCPVVM